MRYRLSIDFDADKALTAYDIRDVPNDNVVRLLNLCLDELDKYAINCPETITGFSLDKVPN